MRQCIDSPKYYFLNFSYFTLDLASASSFFFISFITCLVVLSTSLRLVWLTTIIIPIIKSGTPTIAPINEKQNTIPKTMQAIPNKPRKILINLNLLNLSGRK